MNVERIYVWMITIIVHRLKPWNVDRHGWPGLSDEFSADWHRDTKFNIVVYTEWTQEEKSNSLLQKYLLSSIHNNHNESNSDIMVSQNIQFLNNGLFIVL